jgi:hypothetical protein
MHAQDAEVDEKMDAGGGTTEISVVYSLYIGSMPLLKIGTET